MRQLTLLHLIFVTSGIGLAPLPSLVLNVIDNRDKYKNIDIIYGIRSPANLCFKYDLDAWDKDKTVNMVITIDRSLEVKTGKVGFVPALQLESEQ